MTSLIFGSIYLGHKGIVNHRREKQRQKNYQRWEGLRDEYDEQRKISRESRSLDIQRTGSDYGREVDVDRPILTLRDQQEANDARTSWRPQESFDGSASSTQAGRRSSVEVTAGSGLRPLMQPHKTGATWDEGLPSPLRVSRRNWDDYQPSGLSGNVSRSGSVKERSSTAGTPAPERSPNKSPAASVNKQVSPQPEYSAQTTASHLADHRSVSMPAQMNHQQQQQNVAPVEHATPGGLMAELIESGNSAAAAQQRQQSQFSHPPYNHHSYSQPPPQYPFSQPHQTGAYGGFQTNPYGSAVPAPAPAPVSPPPQTQNGGMQEWWNRPL